MEVKNAFFKNNFFQINANFKQQYEIFPIIVRKKRECSENDEFISTYLASRPENVHEVFSESFVENLTAAFAKIVNSI